MVLKFENQILVQMTEEQKFAVKLAQENWVQVLICWSPRL